MKNIRAIFAALVLFAVPLVHAQVSGTFPLASSVLMTNSTATLTDVVIQVTPSKLASAGILIMPTFSAANAGTSNVVFTFDLSPDGTTYSTTGPVTFTAVCNGTNTVIHWANIFQDELPNTQYLKLSSISTTQTNRVTVSSVKYFMISP